MRVLFLLCLLSGCVEQGFYYRFAEFENDSQTINTEMFDCIDVVEIRLATDQGVFTEPCNTFYGTLGKFESVPHEVIIYEVFVSNEKGEEIELFDWSVENHTITIIRKDEL